MRASTALIAGAALVASAAPALASLVGPSPTPQSPPHEIRGDSRLACAISAKAMGMKVVTNRSSQTFKAGTRIVVTQGAGSSVRRSGVLTLSQPLPPGGQAFYLGDLLGGSDSCVARLG